MSLQSIFGEEDVSFYKVQTHSKGADGSLPLTSEMLLDSPSGDLFGLSQNVGMGWAPSNLLGKQVLILGTQGGIRNHDGTPIALGIILAIGK